MHVKSMFVAVPLALLAACGGSGSESGSGSEQGADTSVASPTPATTAATVATTAADTAPAAFGICRSCHSVTAGVNGVGPTLHGIVGSKAGEVQGFPFSPALKESGITWDRQSLDAWLQGPMKMVPGTKMVVMVPDAARRKEIIDYLETLK
ncbi:cytochrome c [Novosphingobium sp. PhB165]|uniref:c-type cytochrome n=1 Tax=Novosphingobium sp. PhB165 TaxID=2485105 RepID=UPI00104CC1E7|nr:cytochrome C [Novosphingobium sp. PhB165]TCM18798.1 cytochrome c [Novosphingobium sp. PhB165]